MRLPGNSATERLPVVRAVLAAALIASISLAGCEAKRSSPAAETDPAVLTAPAAMDPTASPDTTRYSLQDAAAKGLVEYEVHGNGGSSGESLVVGVRRLVDFNVDVYIRPGTVFVPGGGNAQRMVAWGVVGVVVVQSEPVRPVTSMYLHNMELRLYVLEAYCLDFERDNPSLDDILTPSPVLAEGAVEGLDVRAAQIIYEGKRRKLSIPGIQVALWHDRDRLRKEQIQEKFKASDKEVDDAFEMLKNLPPPKKR